jgi:hypothetical protein
VRHGARRRRAHSDLNDDGLAQILARQRLDFGGHRGAEQQRLTVLRQLAHDAVDLRREAHVEHAVRLVQHEHLEVVEHHVLPLEVVDQAARRCDDDVHAAAQLLLLRVERHPAEHRRDGDRRMSGVFAKALVHLHAQLARRRQDERSRAPRSVHQPVDDRQCERRSLARAGLSQADEVASATRQGDRVALDRRRRRVSGVADGREDALVETQRLETDGLVGAAGGRFRRVVLLRLVHAWSERYPRAELSST